MRCNYSNYTSSQRWRPVGGVESSAGDRYANEKVGMAATGMRRRKKAAFGKGSTKRLPVSDID